MPRPYCEICHFPTRTCICELVRASEKVKYDGQIHVIQHPLEVGHAKNSVQLVKQLMPALRLWQGETPEELEALKNCVEQQSNKWACFFPTSGSQLCTTTEPKRPDTHLLFIDATWRKARKIWHLNQWLRDLPVYHLPENIEGRYNIRKNHASHQLSTLEAIAHTINSVTNSEPLLHLFQEYQERMSGFSVKSDIERS